MAGVAERLGQLGAMTRSSRAEIERTQRAIADARAAIEADERELAALSARLDDASAEPGDVGGPDAPRSVTASSSWRAGRAPPRRR